MSSSGLLKAVDVMQNIKKLQNSTKKCSGFSMGALLGTV